MKLTKENIAEWKKDLDKKMLKKHGFKNYSSCLGDDQWIKDYLGSTPEDVIEAEEDCFEPA